MKVILLMAQTADGIVAKSRYERINWTGSEDKKYFADVTRAAGVVIMGSRTFGTLPGPLPGRLNIVMTKDRTRRSLLPNLIFTDSQPDDILHGLEMTGHKSACLIGGPTINTIFARAGLIDYVHVTTIPRLFGAGLSMFSEPIDIPLAFSRRLLFEDGGNVFIYNVVKNLEAE